MDTNNLIDIQNRIVFATTRGVSGEWDALVVNIEIGEIEGQQTENCLALAFARKDTGWDRNSFQLPYECYDLFSMLRDSADGEKWTACTLEIDSTGKYRFSYTFDELRRLNGVHDDVSLMKNYVPPPLS